ncbi:hypothetical protein OCU04_004834 [Sclerotinia nivalis]|uniref:Uncharacterized protein n=1 Tax=Sclerotinia nivalis TaxID=352851 RepID=A0A9X0AR92_9HELO|nr:hypothetical protein OCU04_004834 [Sclerotinia nivalis]
MAFFNVRAYLPTNNFLGLIVVKDEPVRGTLADLDEEVEAEDVDDIVDAMR